MSTEQWTVKRLLEWTRDFFKTKSIEKPQLEAEILLAAAMKIKRIEIYTNFNTEPTESQRSVFRDFVKRRGNGEPTAYLVGHKEFYSLPFQVNKHVLIPRPETEDLVLKTLDVIKTLPSGALTIADIGTGSGAIAVALAKNIAASAAPVKIIAVDISAEALALAKQNAESNGVADKIAFLLSDLLDAVKQPLDMIISNPPYISEAEYQKLPKDVKDFEPKSALLAGAAGWEVIERLLPQAEKILKPGGHLLLEVSPMITASVINLFNGWKQVSVYRDSFGRERIVHAVREPE
ncbi:release factor glutamine methyltransferase [Planctomycetales bacterium]|nr:release factor glutamine methyltransferase [Planctomycetales bacterium]